MRSFSFIEIFITLTIVLMIIIGGIITVWQINNPEEYCQIARKTQKVEELPAYCIEKEMFPRQMLDITVENK